MQLRDFALRILSSDDIEVKLAAPRGRLADQEREAPEVSEWPARPERFRIRPGKDVRVPPARGMADPEQLRRVLHALANHELQAVELFALALVRFPAAPPEFRRGLLAILREEQRHTRMYIARLRQLGGEFGDYPVTGYFWNKAPQLTTPVRFVCAMSLTFENSNLDHTTVYAAEARRLGDARTLAIVEKVQRDEIFHVRFGVHWLTKFKAPGESLWDAYRRHLAWPLNPGRARGQELNVAARQKAGLDADFIAQLTAWRFGDAADSEADAR
ncbi:MAG: DUF455 family protein [Planctomycetota bacterium]